MKNNTMTSRCAYLVLVAFFLLASPFAGAYAACCAGHGGVASCNQTIGYKMCKDGTASPSCKCKKAKATKKTTTKPMKSMQKPATKKATVPSTTTEPKQHWWNSGKTKSTPATNKKTKSTNTMSAQGCCSRHGGVARCNSSTGYQMCNDGTQSVSCVCH